MKITNSLICTFIGLAILFGVIAYFFWPLYEFEGLDKGLEGVLLFSSISLGFYGACLSVLASIFNTKIVKSIMDDRDDKKEFGFVIFSTLISGFLTVFITIFYRVILATKGINSIIYSVTNAAWLLFTIMFVCMNILFIIMSFLIFFNNTEGSLSTGPKSKVIVPDPDKM